VERVRSGGTVQARQLTLRRGKVAHLGNQGRCVYVHTGGILFFLPELLAGDLGTAGGGARHVSKGVYTHVRVSISIFATQVKEHVMTKQTHPCLTIRLGSSAYCSCTGGGVTESVCGGRVQDAGQDI